MVFRNMASNTVLEIGSSGQTLSVNVVIQKSPYKSQASKSGECGGQVVRKHRLIIRVSKISTSIIVGLGLRGSILHEYGFL